MPSKTSFTEVQPQVKDKHGHQSISNIMSITVQGPFFQHLARYSITTILGCLDYYHYWPTVAYLDIEGCHILHAGLWNFLCTL